MTERIKPAGELLTTPLFATRRTPPARPRLLSLGEFEATGDYVFHRHQHLEYELIVPQRGAYRGRINGAEVVLRAPQALLVKPFDWHEDLLARGVRYWAVRFALEDSSVRGVGGWFRDQVTPTEQICTPPHEALRGLLARMRAESRVDDRFAEPIGDAMVGELVWRLARAFPSSALAPGLAGTSSDESFPARLERWFESRVRLPLRVGEMARALGTSPTALGLRCRRHLGVPPAKAFARFKLDRAFALLSRTGMSVVEVADHLGYVTPFVFSRSFKRRFGYPPSHVRRRT
jgi:AraC-like DNA-binding protein